MISSCGPVMTRLSRTQVSADGLLGRAILKSTRSCRKQPSNRLGFGACSASGRPAATIPIPRGGSASPGHCFLRNVRDQLLKQFVARWTTRDADRRAEAAYHELVQRTGNCVVLAHSQGGFYAFNVAARQPAVCALVCIEPVVPLLEEFDPGALKGPARTGSARR